MIIVFLAGGLGNQMFQFAAGKALALKNRQELKLDLSSYVFRQPNETHREYELSKVFSGNFAIATRKDLQEVLGWKLIFHQHPFLRRVFKKLAQSKSWIIEPYLSYWPDFFSQQSDCLIDGYWQSSRYFDSCANEICNEFTFKMNNFKSKSLLEKIKNSNSVSIHIRRGDYVNDKTTASFYGSCEPGYYEKAINTIKDQSKNPEFFIFSDNVNEAKKLLPEIGKATFVSDHSSYDNHFDMMLMSHCKHNIIANSTFSWWGAWLNKNAEKIVIAPKVWFASKLSDSDLIPAGWRRV